MIVAGAFEPFGGRARNRAADAASHLAGAVIGGQPVEVARLPVVFAELGAAVAALFDRTPAPALVLLVGESAEAHTLLVERIAINVAHADIPDNAGARPIDDEVERGGEPARRVTFDPRIAANAALATGTPCEVSSHAGTFCCNAALYHALGEAARRGGVTRVAFVHVPARWPWARDRRAARGLAAVAEALMRTSH
jgi:pyroglutamyl-peptidase